MKKILSKLLQNTEKLESILKDTSHPLLKDVRIREESYKDSIRRLIVETLLKDL